MMDAERIKHIRKRLTEIPREETKLRSEAQLLKRELDNISTDEAEALAVFWDGKEAVSGKLIRIETDPSKWRLLIRLTDFDFVLVDVHRLRSNGATQALALKLAAQLANQSMRYHPDHITISAAGDVF